MKKIALILMAFVYGLTANKLLQSGEVVLSKHPLFIYSVVVLGLLVLALRLQQEKSKAIILFIELFFLILYYISLGG